MGVPGTGLVGDRVERTKGLSGCRGTWPSALCARRPTEHGWPDFSNPTVVFTVFRSTCHFSFLAPGTLVLFLLTFRCGSSFVFLAATFPLGFPLRHALLVTIQSHADREREHFAWCPPRIGNHQTEVHPIVSPTNQLHGPTGNQWIMMHPRAKQAQAVFAAQYIVISSPASRITLSGPKKPLTSNRARCFHQSSIFQLA